MTERGDICWVDHGPVVSSAPAKRRPVLVVQADAFTRSQLHTVVVAVMTSNTGLAGVPGCVFAPAAVTGLPKDSVVMPMQLVTLDREHLGPTVGRLTTPLLTDVDAGLRRALSL